MTSLMKRLADYGADISGAMERFMDDEELYEQCMEMFREDESFDKLGRALDAGDYRAAFEQAHTLKGVVGNLGLVPLLNAVCNIVEPLRSGDYSNLDDEYKAIMAEKEKLFSLF